MQRSTPQDQGIPASVIADFIRALDGEVTDSSRAVHSVMVLRHGCVIGEGWWYPFRPTDPHMLYSLSKSFTSTAVGLAVFERLLTIDDRIIDLLPDDVPSDVSANLAAMRVRDLLTMTTGHTLDTMPPYSATQHNWARAILAKSVHHLPGTHFVYNSGATYLLSASLQRLTGKRLLDYLTPRLLTPLGITNATWEQCPRGIDVGGWGLAITTEQIAAFGQLILDGGVANGRQLVPEDWVTDATSAQVANGDPTMPDDGTQGYGYQFWRNRHQTYRADGAFGQMSIGIPEHDMVIVMTGGHSDAQRLRDIVWNTLLSALDGRSSTTGASAIVPKLELPHPLGVSGPASAIRGTWVLDPNASELDALSLVVVDGGTELRITSGDTVICIDCGYRQWRRGSIARGMLSGEFAGGGPIAASGAWVGDEFTAIAWFTETPYALILTIRFDGDRVEIEIRPNVSFADPIMVDRMSGVRRTVALPTLR